MTNGHFRGCLRFSFVELKKPAINIFFQNLHLLSFPTIYSLPCFPLKWRAYKFFPQGHPRRSGVTLRCSTCIEDSNTETRHYFKGWKRSSPRLLLCLNGPPPPRKFKIEERFNSKNTITIKKRTESHVHTR